MKKNLLLLGGLGFIGQNLIEELKNDYHLIVFGRDKNHNSLDYTYYSGDFTNTADVEALFKEWHIDIVVHAISSTTPASNDIDLDIKTNLTSTIQLLELLKKYSVKKIVFLSSGGTVYGITPDTMQVVPESYQTYPISSHGINKLAIEKYLYLYHYSYGIDYLILRLSNPFGEKHSSSKQGLINIALKKILLQEPVIIWGDGQAVRDYIYIKDCVKIIHELIDKNIYNNIINVGSGLGYSVNQILDIMRRQLGDFAVEYKPARHFDVPRIVLDIHTLQSLIQFQPTPIELGIHKTQQWLKEIL